MVKFRPLTSKMSDVWPGRKQAAVFKCMNPDCGFQEKFD